MSELKCCPFCGGEATLKRDQKDDFVEWSIGCYNRGCVCSAHTYCYDNKDDAIRDWNTRKPMDNIVEKLEEEYVDCQKNMNLVKDEDGNEAGHIYDEYLNKSIAYETAINIVKQEINNGLE